MYSVQSFHTSKKLIFPSDLWNVKHFGEVKIQRSYIDSIKIFYRFVDLLKISVNLGKRSSRIIVLFIAGM